MLKKFLIGTFAVAALAFAMTASAAYDFGTTTLKVGSKGPAVVAVQTLVGATADGSFGPMTAAKVKVWQAANGLTADGVFGPASKAKGNSAVVGTTYPAGCTSAVGYSSTTGVKCTATTTGGEVTTGALKGGAGDIVISATSTDVDDTVKEGANNAKVLGFKVEAQDSDIAVTNLKVTLQNIDTTSSERISSYLDEVSIYMGDVKVGSADIADFTRESTSGNDEYTKSIALSNAIVRDGKEAKFYVAVSAVSGLDSENADAEINVTADTLRFQDATGVITTESVSDEVDAESFTFTDSSTDDSITMKSSSANPEETTVAVDDSDKSDETLALAYKLSTDSDSADVTVTSIPVTLTVVGGGADADNIDNIVDTVTVKIGSESYEADLVGSGALSSTGTGTATYKADLDDGVVIGAGDTAEVKVYVTFNKQDGNYAATGTKVTASTDHSAIKAETADDDITVDGSSRTGGEMTLSLSTATVTVSSKSSDVNDDQSVGTYSFAFKVEANGDQDITVNAANVLAEVLGPVSNTAAVTKTLTKISGTADESPAGTFTISSGDYATFTIDITVTPTSSGNNGVYRVRLDSVAGTDLGDEQLAGPESLNA